MRRSVLLLVLLAGCGNHDVVVDPACTDSTFQTQVARMAPLDKCFQHAAGSADVQNLGANVIETTEQLADKVRKRPHSRAAVELGYLVGVVRKDAKGVHYEIGRRVEQELIGVPTNTAEFRSGLAKGLR